ncbi:hypothetical protein BCD67_08515 [Oscillatoriales cyanobacterium USR001]|nr:hypothetical protein BCD67_08515 [Oscillatoriales cyanobacterium USR001]
MTQATLSPQPENQGRQVSLNGRTFWAPWTIESMGASGGFRTWISDVSLMQITGINLLNSVNSAKQPIEWFSQVENDGLVTRLTSQYRYLDITDFAKKVGWQMSKEGNILKIITLPAQVGGIRQGQQEWGDRIVLDLDRPTSWRLNYVDKPTLIPKDTPDDPTKPTPDDPTKPNSQDKSAVADTQEWLIVVDGKLDPAWVGRTFTKGKYLKLLRVESAAGDRTYIRVNIPLGWRPMIFSLGNRDRLVIDIRPDYLVERDILWNPGIRWRSQYRNLGNARFPVFSLEVNPRQSGIKIRPILNNPPIETRTAPLLKIAADNRAIAAINSGFFNRINRLALGAIRRDNRWLSGPILNRGAIAWNDAGEMKINRLSLQETVITSKGDRLAITHLNSAYVQAGIGRYTAEWGANYTPFSDGEIIVTVDNNQVISQTPGGAADKTKFPIPKNGYLLALRSHQTAANQLAIGTNLRLETVTIPADFNRYPYILAGGPVLVQKSQVVLDPKAEGFSNAYVSQTAIRSAVGITATGNLLIVTIYNRAGGAGATFADIAQIMQQLGVVEALNFDGGSSTSLYLGGELLDRPIETAAAVHNGLGIFIK